MNLREATRQYVRADATYRRDPSDENREARRAARELWLQMIWRR